MSGPHFSGEAPIILNSDLGVRHAMAANVLGLDLGESAGEWHQERTDTLAKLLSVNLGHEVTTLDAAITREALNSRISQFRDYAQALGKMPVVVSLDPAFLDVEHSDYVFQQTRASILSPEQQVVDLEHNPRGYVNRFTRISSDSNNGAGKPLAVQRQEVRKLMGDSDQVALAFVEDYVNNGSSFATQFDDLTEIPHTCNVFTGYINRKAWKRLAEQGIHVNAVWSSETTPSKYMDMTDLLPTLGGRVIGWSRDIDDGLTPPVPRAASGIGRRIPLAVDAIYGNYPWQVDIYSDDSEPDFMEELRGFSYATAKEFWASLERAAGKELTWENLTPLAGYVKTFYPARDLQAAPTNTQNIGVGPRAVVEAIEDGRL